MAAADGVETLDTGAVDDVADAVLTLTRGRGADSVIDAVGMEAHGNPVACAVSNRFGIDRLAAVHASLGAVRRGGTVSFLGVCGGMADPMRLMDVFDKQITLRMGNAKVRRWSDQLLDLLRQDDDVLEVEGLATHHLPLEAAADGYSMFKEKRDRCVKVVLQPSAAG